MSRHAAWLCALVMATGSTLSAQQQDFNNPPAPPATQSLAPQQLDDLVAPVALYPDPLLGQVLAASTYPVELVEAQQWLTANRNLQGQQLTDAARQQNWDPSVQALVAMPDVMNLLTQDIRWTTDLGNAFLAQQGDVMSAVQRMRQRAQANGQLRSTPQETVTTEYQGGQPAIEIEPADPEIIYVPVYDPYYVYGWGSYPPLYYPDGYWFGPAINIGFFYGGWGGWGSWGWGTNWFGRNLYVNGAFFNRYGYRYRDGFRGGFTGRTNWVHDPVHRLGANYPSGGLNNRYGAAAQASRIAAGRSGNWRMFNGGTSGNVNVNGNGFRSFQGGQSNRNQAPIQQRMMTSPRQGTASGQRFQNYQSPQTPQRSFQSRQTPQRNFQATPQRNFQAPQRNYQMPAPQQRSFAAPQRSFQSAPRMSAPAYGGARNFGGGGNARSSGNGGGRVSGNGNRGRR